MPQKKFLVILSSIVASWATQIKYEDDTEMNNWTDLKPLQIVVSWYLKHAVLVDVVILYGEESDFLYPHLSKFISEIHEKSENVVLLSLIEVELENSKSMVKEFFDKEKKNDKRQDKTVKIKRTSFSSKFNFPISNGSSSKKLTIFLIPDEKTFLTFLNNDQKSSELVVKFSLFILIKKTEFFCKNNSNAKSLNETTKNILQKVWSTYRLLNIFLIVPTSPCIKDYIFTWDPFFYESNNFTGTLKNVKITGDDPNVDETLSGFVNSLKNMNGYPLKVVIFGRVPTVFMKNETRTYQKELNLEELEGLDSMVLKTITSWINCSVVLLPPSDNTEYGYQIENGTFLGMIGDIISRKVDFAANGVFLKDYGTGNATEFTNPISWDSMCIVVPKAGLIPQWLQLFLGFTPLVWSILISNIVICALLRHVFGTVLQNQVSRRITLNLFIETTMMFLSSPVKLPRRNAERVFVGFCMLFNLIVIGTFQGTLDEGFTNRKHYKNVDSLADLDESGLPIGTSSPNLGDIFSQDDNSPIIQNLRRKIKISDTITVATIEKAANERNIAAIGRKNDLVLITNTKYLNERGERVLHTISECPRNYYLAYLVPSNAFYLERMNFLINRMFESGLPTNWYNSTVDFLILQNHYAMSKKYVSSNQATPFNLIHLQTSFFILMGGLFLSTLVFIGEKFSFRYKVVQ